MCVVCMERHNTAPYNHSLNCVLAKKRFTKYCTIIPDLISDSILWLLIDEHVLGYSFIIAGVYLPCESSVHYFTMKYMIT